ncbi:MAG: hypothetical protein IJU41_06220 [Clostridia bacterium]|nr:hypothetical protein [Clostridia bacterium]
MKKANTTGITVVAVTGMVIGAAMGITASRMMKPKKSKIADTAGKALGALGEMVQNVSSYF